MPIRESISFHVPLIFYNNFSIKERTQKERVEKKLTQKEQTPEERVEKHILQKIEAQKKYPEAYEPWTKSNDEFLKNYWNDESNKQGIDEKIQKLSEKLGRNKGGIRARLKKMGLD